MIPFLADRSLGRILPLIAAAFLANALQAAEPLAAVAVPPKDALARLLDGNQRFALGKPEHPNQTAARRAENATSQSPFAIIVSCSDSRVGPEVVFDAGIGDLFVVRTAGEVVTDVELASIEYAAEHLGTTLIVVLGHERCGAVAAAIAGGEAPGHMGALVSAIKPAVEETKDQPGDHAELAMRAQVKHTVAQIAADSPLLTEPIKAGKLQVVGARYDLDTGKVELLP
jgi:carbonic anhydrase